MLCTGFAITPAQVAASDPAVCIGCGVCETFCPQTPSRSRPWRRRPLRRRPQHLPRLRHLRRRVPDGRHPARRLQRRGSAGGGARSDARPLRRRTSATARSSPSAAASAPTRRPTRAPTRARRCRRRSAWCSMPCTGRVSPLHLLSALADGADGVMVAGCLRGPVPLPRGQLQRRRPRGVRAALLKSVGVEPERCRMFTMSAGEPPKFVAAVREMDRVITGLPPLPHPRARAVSPWRAGRRERSRLMPLTDRGREILARVPGGTLQSTAGVGCEIVRHEELCVGCGKCAKNCPSGASRARRVLRREPAPRRTRRQPSRRPRNRASPPHAPRARRPR